MPTRRPMYLAIALLIAVLLVGAVVLGFVVEQEPRFYKNAAKADDYETREKASRLMTRIQELKNDIRTKSEWGETFTVEEMNCFFAEMMSEAGSFNDLLPKGFNSPRVAVEGDRLKLGFHYGRGFWSTVIWVELRIWLVAEETNLMAIEVCDLRAGRLGIGTQSILDAIGDAARNSNIDVTWYRHNGNPVGLFRFYPDLARPPSQILTLEVLDSRIVIAGRSVSSEPVPAAAKP